MGIFDWMMSQDKGYNWAWKKLQNLKASRDADTAAGQAAIAEAEEEVRQALEAAKENEKEDA